MEATDSGTETGNKALVSRFPSIRIWPSIARPREGAHRFRCASTRVVSVISAPVMTRPERGR